VEDWFQILIFLVIFIVLPLLQGLGKKKEQPPPDSAEYEEGVLLEEEPPGGWSEGWGTWPGEEERPEPQPRVEPAPAERVRRETIPVEVVRETRIPDWKEGLDAHAEVRRPDTRVELRRTDTRVEVRRAERAAPVPMRLDIDRAAEHRRFHSRLEPVEVSRPARRSALSAALHGSQLRQAVVLAEVLGPPRALQPREPRE
jgi:hypothetical protein